MGSSSSVREGAAACAAERTQRSSTTGPIPSKPPQTARSSTCRALGSTSPESVAAITMGLRVAGLTGNLPPHIPPLITAWSAELGEQHRRPAYERAMRTTLDLYPTPRSRPSTSLSPRQRATAACEPPEPPSPPELMRPSTSMGQPSPRSYLGRGMYLRPFTAPVRLTPSKRATSQASPFLTLALTSTLTLAFAPILTLIPGPAPP